MRLSGSALITLALTAPVTAQQQVSLTRPDAVFEEPFTQLRGLRELADGRVLVSDMADKVVQVVDFSSGTGTRIGREGQGPGEYNFPRGAWALPDGSSIIQDLGNQRFLVFDAAGKFLRSVSPPRPAPPSGGGGGVVMIGGLVDVRGVDSRGRIYAQGSVFSLDGASGPDSVPLLRWDVGTERMDTVAWKPMPPAARPQVVRSGGGANITVRAGMARAWPAEPQWSVAPDGRIALVTPEPYRVTWISPTGARTTGPVVPVTPIRVTEAEKKAWREGRSRARPVVMTFGGGGGSGARSMNVGPPSEDPEWPEAKPPFTGQDAVLVSPAGEVWVERTRTASDNTPKYDVFDGAGRLVRVVTLRPRSRVAGFGKGAVYVVRSDEDDLQYLERFRP